MLGTATSKMPPSKATQLQNQETVLVLFLALPLGVCGILGIQECGTNLTQDATLEVRYLTRNSRALPASWGRKTFFALENASLLRVFSFGSFRAPEQTPASKIRRRFARDSL